jgi:hypothetical protein
MQHVWEEVDRCKEICWVKLREKDLLEDQVVGGCVV